MIQYDDDDLPGYTTFWPDKACQPRRNNHQPENGVYLAKQRVLALAYYRRNRDAINAKRRATRPSRAKHALLQRP